MVVRAELSIAAAESPALLAIVVGVAPGSNGLCERPTPLAVTLSSVTAQINFMLGKPCPKSVSPSDSKLAGGAEEIIRFDDLVDAHGGGA
jgi:hypothetical protein